MGLSQAKAYKLMGYKDVGDLTAIADFIKHVNDAASADYKAVVTDFAAAKAARETLEAQVRDLRDQLQPSCEAFVKARNKLVVGSDQEGPLMNRLLAAQGKSYNMMLLGKPVRGCVDQCKVDSHGSKSRVPCDLGGCRGTLEGMSKLDSVLGGLEWKDRDADARSYCAEPGDHELSLDGPGGWEDMEEEASVPLGVAAFALLAGAPELPQPKAASSRCCHTRPVADFL